jgi:hypothetical protein
MLDRLSVLLASVLPSSEKGRKSLLYRGEKCLNCEHPLDKSDRFCPNCSQLNSTKKLHFKDLFQEFFAGLIAYDSRLVRTLRVILFQPGKISKEYIAGKRMYYANPFRFYLSVSILFFLLYALLTKIDSYNVTSENVQNNKNWKINQTTDARDGNVKVFNNSSPVQINWTKNENPVSKSTDSITEETLIQEQIMDSLAVTSQKTKEKENARKISLFGSDSTPLYTQKQLDSIPDKNNLATKFGIFWNYYNKNPETKPIDALNELQHPLTTKNLWMYKKVVDLDYFIKNPDFAFNFFISKLPFVIFFFIPFFAFFIKLLYIRKNRFTYMEHLVFAFHVQSLFFVLLTITILFDYLFNTDLFSNIALLLFALYLYKAMRKFYEQGRFKTIVKFMILNTLFSILAMFAAIFYAFLSFSLY